MDACPEAYPTEPKLTRRGRALWVEEKSSTIVEEAVVVGAMVVDAAVSAIV